MKVRHDERHESDATPSREVAQRYCEAIYDDDRVASLALLHYRGGDDEFNLGKEYCSRDEAGHRATGADILAQLGWGDQTFRDESIEILIRLLDDSDTYVVCRAAVALGHRSAESAIPALLRLADHPDSQVRYGVTFGLLGHEDSRAIAGLIRLALRIAIVIFLPSMTSCSALIASRGKNVFKYQEHPQNFSREQVIADLGPPSKTERIDPPESVKSLERHRRSIPWVNQADSRSRIAIIDEHLVRGPVFDQCANYGAVICRSLAFSTFGLSEIYFVPVALSCETPDRTFYTFFDTDGRLVTSSLMPADHGKSVEWSQGPRPNNPQSFSNPPTSPPPASILWAAPAISRAGHPGPAATCCRCDARCLLRHGGTRLKAKLISPTASKLAGPTAAASCTQSTVDRDSPNSSSRVNAAGSRVLVLF